MSQFSRLEAQMMKTLQEEGELRPPAGRLAQEWFWQAAAWLQARGLCVADQVAGVVRLAKVESLGMVDLTFRGHRRAGLVCVTDSPSDGSLLQPDIPWRLQEPDPDVFNAQLQQEPAPRPTLEPEPRLERAAVCTFYPATDLPARLRLLLGRWRQKELRGGAEGLAYRQCANSLEEVMEECGVRL